MKRDRVELMVAHHGQSRSTFDHAAHNRQDIVNLWPAVNIVTAEHGLSGFVPKAATFFAVAEFFKQFDQFVRVPVYVADDVVNYAAP
ncbi:MAG: hypothetical protein R3C19_04975 [Planctomycetaceae bacterium]